MRKKLLVLLLCTSMALNMVLPARAEELRSQEDALAFEEIPDQIVKPEQEEETELEGAVPGTETELEEGMPGTESEEEESEILKLIKLANEKLKKLTDVKDVQALVYLCDDYTVKAEPESDAADIAVVSSGQQVCIRKAGFGDGKLWYFVKFNLQDQEYTGYIEKEYLAYSDEDFIAWEEENIFSIFPSVNLFANGQSDVGQFPASYQSFLSGLKNAHPNWTFVKFDTGLNWNTVVSEEMTGARSLVPTSSPDSWKKGNYGDGWSYASEGALKYYLDPRNFLNENYMFQFEQLTFNRSYHTEGAIQKFLNSTFMAGSIPGDSQTYAAAFWRVGNNLGVSPFHLASRVYQEQGQGKSPLISGNYPGYEGLYNYYNIGATGSTDEQEIQSGLQRAREEGWTTRYLSLEGGARILSQNYILKGQDTLYLQKFDVDGSANGLYWHQYMQNICAPANEGANIRKLYMNTNSLNNTFVFKIPVYNNMPSQPCKIDSIADQLEYYAPIFNIDYYMNRYSDLKKNYGSDTVKYLQHFVEHGMKEGRQGNEEFNVYIYRANYADLNKVYGSDLEKYYDHYIRFGKKEGRNAKMLLNPTTPENPDKPDAGLPEENVTVYEGRDYKDVFNAEYYANHCADLKKYYGADAAKYLQHFVEHGMQEGRQGNEEFNAKIYSANYNDLSKYYGSNWEKYYDHYMRTGKAEGRNGKELLPPESPDVPENPDPDVPVTPDPDVPQIPDTELPGTEITVYEGRDYKDVFNAKYYASRCADLRKYFGTNAKLYLQHFVEHGMKEGRQGSEEFNAQIYSERYSDLKKYYGNNWELYYDHYMRAGKAEGRKGN